MTKSEKQLTIFVSIVLGIAFSSLLLWIGFQIALQNANWGYARSVSPQEEVLRQQVVTTAESWLGRNEADGSHEAIRAAMHEVVPTFHEPEEVCPSP